MMLAANILTITKRRNNDPTLTLTLRRRMIQDINARFGRLKKQIRKKLIDENFLAGYKAVDQTKQGPIFARVIPIGLAVNKGPFRYTYDHAPEKMEQFMDWLEDQEALEILNVIRHPTIPRGYQAWSDVYIQSSYQAGLAQARKDLIAEGIDIPSFEQYPGGVSVVMNQPFHADRAALLYTRTFNEMKGITAAMNQQLSRTLAKGMAEGKGPYQIAREIAKRVDNIGINRARLLARTEIVEAHNEGALNEFERSELEIGEEILVQWWSARDSRVRRKHGIHGWHGEVMTQAEGRARIGEPNCLVGDTMIFSPSSIHRTYKRRYDGTVITIRTSKGNNLTCTPNHPILTDTGFIPASALNIGSNVICRLMADASKAIIKNKNNIIALIKDIESAFTLTGKVSFLCGMPRDFHGDGIKGEVTVINTNRKLMNSFNTSIKQHFSKQAFSRIDAMRQISVCLSPFYLYFNRISLIAAGLMRFFNLIFSLSVSHFRPFKQFSFALSTGFNAVFQQDTIDSASRCIEFFSRFINRFTAGIKFNDTIIKIDRSDFSGHVYNLQTGSGLYIAQNIIVGNCRCSLIPWIPSSHDTMPAKVTDAARRIINKAWRKKATS